MLLNFGLKLN